jgi:hypothetical protein
MPHNTAKGPGEYPGPLVATVVWSRTGWGRTRPRSSVVHSFLRRHWFWHQMTKRHPYRVVRRHSRRWCESDRPNDLFESGPDQDVLGFTKGELVLVDRARDRGGGDQHGSTPYRAMECCSVDAPTFTSTFRGLARSLTGIIRDNTPLS